MKYYCATECEINQMCSMKYVFFSEQNQVTGKYSVWLPDGRLMTVEYSVAKETGFVPKITFQDNANPLQG